MEEQKIESIIISFSCLDLLSITLPRNLHELDHVILVTKPEDKETINYCESLNTDKITVVTTDAFTYNGAKFNKGLAINVGFRFLKYFDWVVLMDTDCVLIKNFHKRFLGSAENTELAYGSRRLLIETKKDWDNLCNGSKTENDYLLARGFCYGFFTAFNYNSSTFQRLLKNNRGMPNLPYPYWYDVANEIDWVFLRSFDHATMQYNPPLGKFPECHYEKHNDISTGLSKELPFPIYHLGPVGLNHIIRTTNKFI